ncbi:MAG: RES family NAD+ phosphorylase [Bacteroidota bacterium]
MIVYRLAHPKYAQDISGYGSLLVPGRWNFKGNRVLYTAENSSLAFLEYLAHTEGLDRRLPYLLVIVDLPDAPIETVSLSDLKPTWKDDLFYTRDLGSKWLSTNQSLILKVPSVINEDDCNLLINPQHREFIKVKLITSKEITFDRRLH